MRIIIAGGGLAAQRGCAALRRLGHDGPITLVGDEQLLPYDRPPLAPYETLLAAAQACPAVAIALVDDATASSSSHEARVKARCRDFPSSARRSSVRPCRSGTSWGAARRATSATSGRSLASCASRRCAG